MLLPHNNDVTKPRALNTFLDGLAELGVDKGKFNQEQKVAKSVDGKKATEMQKILPRTRVIMRRVHRIERKRGRQRRRGSGF